MTLQDFYEERNRILRAKEEAMKDLVKKAVESGIPVSIRFRDESMNGVVRGRVSLYISNNFPNGVSSLSFLERNEKAAEKFNIYWEDLDWQPTR